MIKANGYWLIVSLYADQFFYVLLACGLVQGKQD